jgi:hypothetical protein
MHLMCICVIYQVPERLEGLVPCDSLNVRHPCGLVPRANGDNASPPRGNAAQEGKTTSNPFQFYLQDILQWRSHMLQVTL